MAKVFLDTNYFIDAIHRKPEVKILESLESHIVYISALSFHIYCYITKVHMPNSQLNLIKEKFQIVDFTSDIVNRALQGPIDDFEDNVQLHSASEATCDDFLTNDKQLLDIKFFGKTKIIKYIDS